MDIGRIPERVATPEYRAFALEVARRSVTALENRAMPWRVVDPAGCLVVTNGSGERWDADMDIRFLPTHARLYRAVQKRLPAAPTLTVSEAMAPDEMAAAAAAVDRAEAVVFGVFTRVLCYHEDSISVRPAYAELIRRAVATGKPVAVINFGNPYVMAGLARAPAALCTYDDHCAETVEAAVEALFGEIPTRGKLPVRVSAEYPFGHGR